MHLQHILTQRQAKASALPGWFIIEEGPEDFVPDLHKQLQSNLQVYDWHWLAVLVLSDTQLPFGFDIVKTNLLLFRTDLNKKSFNYYCPCQGNIKLSGLMLDYNFHGSWKSGFGEMKIGKEIFSTEDITDIC